MLNVSRDSSQLTTPLRLHHSGYRVARVTRGGEMLAVARRRYMVFVEQMRALPENQRRFDIDSFDLKSEHFYACVDGRVVGSLRLVRARDGLLPMEADGACIPDFIPRATTVEGGRFNAERVAPYNVCGDLLDQGLRWSLRNGVTHWVGVNSERSLRAMQRLGWAIACCGDPIDHAGTPYFPHYINLANAPHRLAA